MEREITGTMVEYYFVCKRKLYYFTKNLTMEQENEAVLLGKLIDENSYGREVKHISVDGVISIDYIEDSRILHEIKKSRAIEESTKWQLKYYLWYLEQKGITGLRGRIDYPLLKQNINIELSEEDRKILCKVVREIPLICDGKIPSRDPSLSICKKCAYYDLCFI